MGGVVTHSVISLPPPRRAELLSPAFSVEKGKINTQEFFERAEGVKRTEGRASYRCPARMAFHRLINTWCQWSHNISVCIFQAGDETSIHFPSHSTHFDEPVSALIVINAIEPCLATQVGLHERHPYFMQHRSHLTKGIFFFFFSLWIEIMPHISLDTQKSLRSVVRWAICFIHALWTSACPDVKNHQAPTGLPPDWL